MVSIEKIIYKIGQLDDFISLLEKIKNTTLESFVKDKILSGAAKYYLQISIECCMDIANHIIASESYRAPKDYADSFKVLEENDIIPPEFSSRLMRMAKFRNRIVHLYGEIDDTYVYEFITNDIDDLKEFKAAIVTEYLKEG